MALHPRLSRFPYDPLAPAHRWFPADEALRSTAYEQLLPPLVARVRDGVEAWRDSGYAGASATSRALLQWWFGVVVKLATGASFLDTAAGVRAFAKNYLAIGFRLDDEHQQPA